MYWRRMQTSRRGINKDQMALLWATKNEYSAVVRLLLDRETNIEAKGRDVWMVVHRAAE
jgi:hypothetical protein